MNEIITQLLPWLPWVLVAVLLLVVLLSKWIPWADILKGLFPSLPSVGVLPMIIVLLILFMLVWLLNGAQSGTQNGNARGDPEYQMGAILVLAIGVLIVLLYIMATGFKGLELADPKHALALPEGSIRALIALFLIMIFVIMNVYLFRSIAGVPSGRLENLTLQEVAALGDRAMDVQPNPTPNPAQPNQTNTFNVILRSKITASGEQLALQLATVLGTLVAAVSAFYFGSTTATSASAQGAAAATGSAPAAPSVGKVLPDSGPPGKGRALTLIGTGFVSGMGMKLSRQGDPSITTPNVIFGNATTLIATFDLPDKTGKWDAVLLQPDGSEAARKSEAFEIVSPVIAKVEPSSSRASEKVKLTLTGTGFVNDLAVKLMKDKTDTTGISSMDVTFVNATTLTATFNLTGQSGKRDVVLLLSDGTEVARKPGTFEIVLPAADPTSVTATTPQVDKVDPSSSQSIASADLKLIGTGFVNGMSVKLVQGASEIPGSNVTVVDPTTITATFNLVGQAGKWNAVLLQPDGSEAARKPDAIEIVP
jgi:hypothetical protein